MSKALTGQLSFWQTGLVSFLFVDSSTLLHLEQPKLFGVLAVLSAIGFTFIRKMFLRGMGTLSAKATPSSPVFPVLPPLSIGERISTSFAPHFGKSMLSREANK